MNNKIILIGIAICFVGMLNFCVNASNNCIVSNTDCEVIDFYEYDDVNTRGPYYDAIKEVTQSNLMTNEFRPYDTISYQDVIVTFYRIANPLEKNHYYHINCIEEAFEWALENQIIKEKTNIYDTDIMIKRQDFAVLLYRYAKSAGLETNTSTVLDDYSDYGEIDGYAIDAIDWCFECKLLSSRSFEVIEPKEDVKREEAAVAFVELKNMIKDYVSFNDVEDY